MMRIRTIMLLLMGIGGAAVDAQQSLYLPFDVVTKRWTKVTQSLSSPSSGNPHQTLQTSLIVAMTEVDPEYFQYSDSASVYRNGSFDFGSRVNNMNGDNLDGLIINFDTERSGSSFLSKVSSIQPVVRYEMTHLDKEVKDTLASIEIGGVCTDSEYSYVVQNMHHFGDSTVETVFLKDVYDGVEGVDLWDNSFSPFSFDQFRSSLMTIDTILLGPGYGGFQEERIIIDTTHYTWENLKAVYQTEIEFCSNPKEISIHHKYVGLAKIVMDSETREFKYDLPIAYIKNRKHKK